LTTGGLQKG